MFRCVLLAVAAALSLAQEVCLPSSSEIEIAITGTLDGPSEGSCCQEHICGLPCPEPVPEPGVGYGIAVGVSIAISFIIGILTIFVVKGESENFFVAGRSLPLWIVAMTLGAQSIDSNALLGNVDLSYKYHFYDGAVLPIGLGLSLILNGIFLAHHVNNDLVLTLPDVFAKRYGLTVEIMVSICTIISFMMLLAGNLVGMANVLSYLWGVNFEGAVWMTAAIVWTYTATGGLFSVAYTDVAQGLMGWSGAFITAIWLITNSDPAAPPPSVGFEGYVYPDEEICQLYNGTNCTNVIDGCCYNPDAGFTTDNGAYPIGDQRIFPNQMSDPQALTPFPNAIFWNWATIFILAFGNLAALDFQARCMASKTPTIARIGCLIGGCVSFLIGIPFSYLGAITRTYYGPDSIHAEFAPDTCSNILGLPTCAAWLPDPLAFIKLLTHQTPPGLGAWCLIGIVAASMSTADGAILAMGTVFSHNITRTLDTWYPDLITEKTLLMAARISTIPFAIASSCIAAYYRNTTSAAGATGYLLIVAFDVVLATVVPSLFGAFYAKKPSPRAAFLSIIFGAFTRILLEFVLPKDGYLLLPFPYDEFLDYGTAASANFPVFFDEPEANLWNATEEPCLPERYYEDYTGVDSLASFLCSIIVFLSVQFLEHKMGHPLFTFVPGLEGYDKYGTESSAGKEIEVEDVTGKTGKSVEEQAVDAAAVKNDEAFVDTDDADEIEA